MQDMNRDPGYWSTSRMLLECALCMIPQNEKLLAADPYASACPAGALVPIVLELCCFRKFCTTALRFLILVGYVACVGVASTFATGSDCCIQSRMLRIAHGENLCLV